MVFTNCILRRQKSLIENYPSLQTILARKNETFQERLMHLIWNKGLSEIQIYKTANIDRRLFSKIRSDADYHPQKQTILSLIIALHLNLMEAEDLLSRAGFAFSPVDTIDNIYQFCIENNIYDFRIIDELVYEQTELINPYTAETSY